MKIEWDLSNYATKADLKDITAVDISDFAKKTNFANLKSDAHELDIIKQKNVPSNLSNLKSKVDKLVPVPLDLSKLSDLVKNAVVKKDVYNAKFKNIADKISDITNLATTSAFNAKINEVKNKILIITN